MPMSFTRRDLLTATASLASVSAASMAAAQNGVIPSSSRELWQWVKT